MQDQMQRHCIRLLVLPLLLTAVPKLTSFPAGCAMPDPREQAGYVDLPSLRIKVITHAAYFASALLSDWIATTTWRIQVAASHFPRLTAMDQPSTRKVADGTNFSNLNSTIV